MRVRARGGVILAAGGFEHNREMRRLYQPAADAELSLGAATNTGDAIRAAQEAGAGIELMDSAWWYPCVEWGPGRIVFSLNERMMPAQLIVNAQRATVHQRGDPVLRVRDRHDRRRAGRHRAHTVLDHHRRLVVAPIHHLRSPAHPVDPVRARADRAHAPEVVARVRLDGRRGRPSVESWPTEWASRRPTCESTVARYNEVAASGHDTDFQRGDSKYDQYYSDITLATPNLAPLHGGPYYAFQLILADLGTNGGVRNDERARALRTDGSAIPGLYVTGNTAASVMGRSYAGAGATIGPAMTFGFIAANDIADARGSAGTWRKRAGVVSVTLAGGRRRARPRAARMSGPAISAMSPR